MFVLSCKHAVDCYSKIYPISLGEFTVDQEGWKPCVTYAAYCKDCYDKALADSETIVLHTIEDEEYFLLYPEAFCNQ